MIWLLVTLLAVAAVAPLLVALDGKARSRGAKGLAVSLHRGQLAELDRDLAEGRIMAPEHATAVLEVQRRLLAAAGGAEAQAVPGSRWPVLAVIVLVPLAAGGLYALGGSPGMPSGAGAVQQARLAEEAMLVDRLRTQLDTMDPASERARQGYVLLGTVEEHRGRDAEAAAAWRRALQGKFDATLAARTAEAEVRAAGGLTPGSEALFRRALAAAPDAPWASAAEARLKQGRTP